MLLWSHGDTGAHAIVCRDARLRAMLGREGFAVLPSSPKRAAWSAYARGSP